MRKIYTFLVVILPIISVYKSPVGELDLGTFIFIILSLHILLHSKGKLKIIKPLLIFLMYIFLSTLVSLQLQSGVGNVMPILRMGKFIFLILLILHFGNKSLFDIEFGLKILKIVTITAVIYLITQTIAYKLFGVLLPNAILSLIIDEAYLSVDYITEAKYLYRPSSFFIEPSSFSQYALLYLSYSIFGLDNKQLLYNWKHAFFISAGILLTGSGQGILLVFFIWVLWVLNRLFLAKLQIKQYFMVLGIVIGAMFLIIFLLQSDFLSKSLSRVFTANISSGGNAFLARMNGYQYYSILPTIFKMIGMGYGNVPSGIYFNSMAYTLYCSGLIGVIILLYIFWDVFRKGIGFQKAFTIIYFGLVMGTTAFKATSICFYFSFIYSTQIKQIIIDSHNRNKKTIVRN